MGSRPYITIDPLLTESEAASLLQFCQDVGEYGMYSDERADATFGTDLPERYDVLRWFEVTGGEFGRPKPPEALTPETRWQRTSGTLFRRTYAYGDDIYDPSIEPYLHNEHLIAAARGIHGRPLVVPAIAYGNIMVSGHEIPLHVDVPEFRGADRRAIPQWLLIVMGQSGLFEDWRLPIATAVSWFHDREFGGQFVLLADGPQGSASTIPVRFNSAIVTDTDSVFHGVERLAGPTGSIAPLSELPIRPGMRLYREADGTWRARGGNAPDVSYRWEELRLSISWKAYCFRDESEYQHWAQHQDGLTLETILQSFVHDLRRRDLMGSDVPSDTKFARLLVDTYVRFPSASVQ